MTAIIGIAATELPKREYEQPKPSRDFSQELPKQHAPSHDDTKAPTGGEEPELHETTVSESPKSDVSMELFGVEMSEQVHATPVDGLPDVVRPLDRATAQPVGVTEALLGARVFGWHALAQSYLSELAAFDAAPDGGKLPTEASASLAQVESLAPEVASGSASDAVETPTVAGTPATLPAAGPVSEIEGASDLVEAGAPSLAALASVDYWSERSLRFVRQPDGQDVAWLRDYRLDVAKAGLVVRLVLQEARAKGIVLERIMLNGREAWSSRDLA